MTQASQSAVRRVVIAGGGTAGWMTAAAIAKTMGPTVDLTLVESEMIGTVGVGEATIPPLRTFNRLLDIPEDEFMRETKATFKLGIQFEGWTDGADSYIHSFGTTGRDHWTSGFQHFWKRGQMEGLAGPLSDYCLEYKAALEGKFARLPNDGMNYAYHLDSSLYAKYLRAFAERHGAVRVEGKIREVVLDPQSGDITSLALDNGQSLEGDLFIDCTGFRALLIEGALHAGYDDWTHLLPCDRAIAVQTQSVRPAAPYTRSIAHDSGWQWRIPLQHRMGNGIVYCSQHLSDDEARERLLSTVEGKTLTEPNQLRFRTGMRREHWKRNCIAVGLASGFMEPLESTSIHLIQRSILRLLRMFPVAGVMECDRQAFNEQTVEDFITIRDFLVLHYNVTERTDSAFWRQCQRLPIPDSLAHRIELFSRTGRIHCAGDELFRENSWLQVMLGQGLLPEFYHPIVDKMPRDELQRFLDQIRQSVSQTVAGLPLHEDYVSQYCGAGETV
ncbi:tryptophan halogenase family protein [Maricaulis parjimensis]|uniref:tryptophan halogenase family protein n=1 Tax=Maricaulis parjimensis TaxID=144023 RepID=UPI00193AB5D0|nr:tryptophan halogenase family protein [Maricaulis parjimensis]